MDLEASALAVGILVTLVWIMHITHVLVSREKEGYDEVGSVEEEMMDESEESQDFGEVEESEEYLQTNDESGEVEESVVEILEKNDESGAVEESGEVTRSEEDHDNMKFVQIENSLRQEVDEVYEADEVYEG